jgi:hypothetical protein
VISQVPSKCAALARACWRAVVPARGRAISLERNLDGAYRWLCAAQDANPDGGVAGCYNFIKGWAPSYPETTGYIIPTFLGYATTKRSPDARDRALRMAEWEIEVQLPEGAVQSGMLGTRRAPAVFNTGQVLFGWTAAYRATMDERFARAAARACDWLVRIQDNDGAWRRHLSVLTSSSVQTYNVRTAWGLAIAGVNLREPKWIQAAERNCEWVIQQLAPNGWFAHNAFSDFEEPLLHTIGYALEGLLGVGTLLDSEECIHAVIRGTAPLLQIYERTRIVRGRYNSQWEPAASWRCLTGEAQVALVMLRLFNITGDTRYVGVAGSLLEGIARLQDLHTSRPQNHGGIGGSYPVWGSYGRFNYLNWAAKFLIDALLLYLHHVDIEAQTSPPAHSRGEVCA